MRGQGGSPHAVAEVMRTISGAIPDTFLPFGNSKTLPEYFSPRPITYGLFKYGYSWMQKYDFRHQWIFSDPATPLPQKQAALMEALKYSMIGASGYAWSLHADGKYYKDGPDIHWFDIFDYSPGEYWLAFDSYAPFIKKLDWNYNFGYSKGYSLTRKTVGGVQDDAMITADPALLPYILYYIPALFK